VIDEMGDLNLKSEQINIFFKLMEEDGEFHWVIDIPYKTAGGKRQRYRRDAQVQSKSGAEAEHRRLIAELAQRGTLAREPPAPGTEAPPPYTFDDAVRHFELAAFTGLRASELRGLRWSDIDLKIGIITVRRGITSCIEVTPRSHDQRVIPIGPRLRAALGAAEPKKKSPWASVALTALGKPWGESGLNQAFQRAQRSVLGAAVGRSTTYATSS